jgi:alpha-beta hydrolase superfamily lysophospholipase
MTPPDWKRDSELGDGFLQADLTFPADYDGPVTATIVRNEKRVDKAVGAVLYVHGYIDYFFQRHLSDWFNGRRYEFYALDLRKYGRSLGHAPHPNFCKDFEEYFAEITAALDIIVSEGHSNIVVNAHSTGALPVSIYAKRGPRKDRISRIIFNSPFLAFKDLKKIVRLLASLGRTHPFWKKPHPVTRFYGESLYVYRRGEWMFNTALKPIENGFPAFFGWIHAVVQVQDEIARGLDLAQPILVMHSDRSLGGLVWREEFHRADLILDVNDMRRLGPRLGKRVVMREIPGGKHDLVLSQADVREYVFRTMEEWLSGP